jgi:hypothetical protein
MIHKFIYKAVNASLEYYVGSIATNLSSNDTGFAADILFKRGLIDRYYVYNEEAKDIRYENI